jgi:glycosyltransferase involved in cell wall biosynthesis
MSSPLVSVILTVFQREQFLRTAIASALAQALSDIEIIVTDDSNMPGIRSICESFSGQNQLRYRTNAKRLGAPLNIRAAMEEANGKYIAILNDDDFWEPSFLSKLVAPLEESERRAVAFSDHWIVRDDGNKDEAATETNSELYGRKKLTRGEIHDPAEFVLAKNGLPLAMAAVFRKTALDPAMLVPEVVGAYDLWISCILAASGKSFYYLPERLTYYRLHDLAETGRKSPDKSQPKVFVFEELLKRNWFPSMRNVVEHRLAEAHYGSGRDLMWFGQMRAARGMFRKAMQVAWHRKSLAAYLLSFAPHYIRQSARLAP